MGRQLHCKSAAGDVERLPSDLRGRERFPDGWGVVQASFEDVEITRLVQFVRDGGSLLVCIKRDWHYEAPFYEDLKPLGIGDAGLEIGSDTWLRPAELELGDNKRLLTNILDWLGRRW